MLTYVLDVEYIRQRRSDPANKCNNLPPHIEQYVGVNLHKRTHHPLNTIKGIIENYFATDYLPRNFSKYVYLCYNHIRQC